MQNTTNKYNQIMLENQREVNKLMGNIGKRALWVVPVMILLWVFKIFPISFIQLIFLSMVSTIALLMPIMSAKVLKNENHIKWVIIITYITVVTVIFSVTYINSMIYWAIPITIAALYYDKKLIIGSLLLSVPGILVGEVVASQLQSEFVAGYEWIILHMVMYLSGMSILVVIMCGLAKRTFRMLECSYSLTGKVQSYLDQNIETSQAVGESISVVNQTIMETHEVVKNVGESIQNIVVSSNDIIEAAYETGNIVNETVGKIKLVEEQTQAINKINTEIVEVTSRNKKSLEKFYGAIENIKEKTDHSKLCMAYLEDKLKYVHEVLGHIGQISDQTELLALNASIEAAKSGESGKGFAVIAEEVKKLAITSVNYGSKVEEMINAVRNDTVEVVEAIGANYEEVVKSTIYIDETNKSFDYFLEVQQSMANQVKAISNVMNEFIQDTARMENGIKLLLTKNEHNANEIVEIEKAIEEITNKSRVIGEEINEVAMQAEKLIENME